MLSIVLLLSHKENDKKKKTLKILVRLFLVNGRMSLNTVK